MALSQSAVSELLEAFRAGEGIDLIRESVRMVMQELVEPRRPSRSARPAMSGMSLGQRAQRIAGPAAGHPGR